jgi:choline dehydrogenase
VLLLEAGADFRGRETAEMLDGWHLPKVPDWGLTSTEPDGSSQKLRRGRLVGGTGWLTRFAVRGPASDFDAWAAMGNPGWGFDDVRAAFRRLERDTDFGDRPWHGAAGPLPITRYADHEATPILAAAAEAFIAAGMSPVEDLNAPDAIGFGRVPMSSRDGMRATGATTYLAGTPAGLVIRSEAPVDRVVVRDGRAVAVRLAGGSELEADEIVLSAGTYGSPAILQRSGIGPADLLGSVGVKVNAHLPGVGANLADHPGVDLDSGFRGPGRREPILHTIATLRSSGSPPTAAPDLMFWAQDPDVDEPAMYFDPILLKPRSRGSVRIRTTDPTDAPEIRLPGIVDPEDIQRLIDGYALGLELANHPAVRRLCADPAPDAPRSLAEARARVAENAYSVPHVVGTCAMGPDPSAGAVVDVHGRVHGIDHLRVVDASIIPAPTAGFPHVITIMAAEHVAARWDA